MGENKDERGQKNGEKKASGKVFFPFNLVMLFATSAAGSGPEYQYKGDIYVSQRKNFDLKFKCANFFFLFFGLFLPPSFLIFSLRIL